MAMMSWDKPIKHVRRKRRRRVAVGDDGFSGVGAVYKRTQRGKKDIHLIFATTEIIEMRRQAYKWAYQRSNLDKEGPFRFYLHRNQFMLRTQIT